MIQQSELAFAGYLSFGILKDEQICNVSSRGLKEDTLLFWLRLLLESRTGLGLWKVHWLLKLGSLPLAIDGIIMHLTIMGEWTEYISL